MTHENSHGAIAPLPRLPRTMFHHPRGLCSFKKRAGHGKTFSIFSCESKVPSHPGTKHHFGGASWDHLDPRRCRAGRWCCPRPWSERSERSDWTRYHHSVQSKCWPKDQSTKGRHRSWSLQCHRTCTCDSSLDPYSCPPCSATPGHCSRHHGPGSAPRKWE